MINHNLLIKTATNVKTVCKKVDGIKDDISKIHKKLDRHIELSEGKLDKKEDKVAVRWMVGLIVVVLLGFGGFMIKNKTCIADNKTKISENSWHIEYGK